MGLYDEIFEQPAVLTDLLAGQSEAVERIASDVRSQDINYVLIAARGSSDHAGLYAKYLWGMFNGLPVALAAPSLFSKYCRPPRLDKAVVVGISQSGQSPDIVSVLTEARRQGALTLAITNAPGSPLAKEAEHIINICAGEEKAVAATKTYTSQLMAIAMLSAALRNDTEMFDSLHQVPVHMKQMLQLDHQIRRFTERYRYMTQCVVLGRGFNYATAFEWSLKLKELTYVVAEPYSPADFQHGPIAIVEKGFPVLAVAPKSPVFQDVLSLLKRLADDYSAELLVLSNDEAALSPAQASLRLPDNMPEWISPLVSIVPAQLFCYHLTVAKGWHTETPRGLKKVTETH